MSGYILTRMGDGERVSLPTDEVRADIIAGTEEAAAKGNIPPLTSEEIDELYDIIADKNRIVSVEPGNEVVMTDDGGAMLLVLDQPDGGLGLSMGRAEAIYAYERICCADTVHLGHFDYSFKPLKAIISLEANEYYNASLMTTTPMFYGSQPNMGLYFTPDGPVRNPTELFQAGDIKGAQDAQDEAGEYMREDILHVVKQLSEVGCEGINFDTAGSSGDAELRVVLECVEEIKRINPGMPIIVGMSGEFVLGMHGAAEYKGKKLAGMYPHEQVGIIEEAGTDIYGPAINVNCSKSFPWNLARAVTFVKATSAVANIPIHPNVGMGVCGIPMFEQTPIDCVTRVAKAMVEIGKADGL
ncbi:MAG: hypothetical protein K9L30_12905 [Desulfobacterales bacterium]|nr:hypothetical protein [Desulfobacterales bacterium]